MSALILWTYYWVPKGPRGFVRDLRLRWACEEAGLVYQVRSVPFDGRETNHLDRQPFGQIPFLSDGDVELFESGAGSLAPIIAIWLYKIWGTTVAVSAYVAFCCAVSGITALLARETKGVELSAIR